MDFNQMDELNSPEGRARAEKVAGEQKQVEVELAQAYNRLFKTTDGQRVLNDLTQKLLYNNDPPFNSLNVNYEAAYRNGEAGVVKLIIKQITRAEVI